jgi:hypothetical protein
MPSEFPRENTEEITTIADKGWEFLVLERGVDVLLVAIKMTLCRKREV